MLPIEGYYDGRHWTRMQIAAEQRPHWRAHLDESGCAPVRGPRPMLGHVWAVLIATFSISHLFKR